MASMESMYVFEVVVEELKSFSKSTNHRIRARFGNVFTLQLADPNELIAETLLPRRRGKKHRVLKIGGAAPSCQTAVVVSDVESLIQSMLNYPVEITHCSKDEPFVLGVAEIPWTAAYMTYLRNLQENPNLPPIVSRETYKTYDEYTSKRVAVIKLKLKVSQLKDNFALTTQIRSKSANSANERNSTAYEFDYEIETGTIKTIYSGGKNNDNSRKKHLTSEKRPKIQLDKDNVIDENNKNDDSSKTDQLYECNDIVQDEVIDKRVDVVSETKKVEYADSKHSIVRISKSNSMGKMVCSQTHIDNNKLFAMTKHWSSTSVEIKERLDTLNYIFGNLDGPFGNRVYCVGYFTVEKDQIASTDSPGKSGTGTPGQTSTNTKSAVSTPGTAASEKSTGSPEKSTGTPGKTTGSEVSTPQASQHYTLEICNEKCTSGGPKNPCFANTCDLDLPCQKGEISMVKCDHVSCQYKRRAASLLDPKIDEIPLLVDFNKSINVDNCCLEKVENVVGEMSTKFVNAPCECTCECTFGFIKKTTYCNICGGFEVPGHQMVSTRGDAPFPCPVYHGLSRGKKGLNKKSSKGDESEINQAKQDKKRTKSIKSVDSDKETVKPKKKKGKDPRFIFNYGYKGIPPQIGHSQCAVPCTGTLHPVPKRMGWLWTANNIPGLKVRPGWKPGAANKHVVRMLRIARYPEELISKRRKRDTGKKKRPLKRPLLVVQKKDGEYHVTMETMKTFTKPRAVNQAPYEDKPVIEYRIGRTDEENAERKKRKERAERRLQREQRAFLQSAFQDMCKEICLKTYQQALGSLPFAEDSFCPCFPELPPPDRIDESHSCSCTESSRSSGSATDDDEWIIEFTPPNAYYNQARVIKKICQTDSASQYNYLDYKVKCLDKFGNQVPRFFIGPDGTKQCSDLGGFWGPDKNWLEINVDGFVGPDGRWAPNSFIGPCGDLVDAETGKFQSSNGVWLTVGVDGFVDCKGKWHFYPKGKIEDHKDPRKQRNVEEWIKAGKCDPEKLEKKKLQKKPGEKGSKTCDARDHNKQLEPKWSCFGDASPRTLSQMGIAGHGQDRRRLISTLEELLKRGEDVKIQQKPGIYKLPGKRKGKKSTNALYPEETKSKLNQKNIEAVNDRGHRTYFHLKEYKNPRPKQRLRALGDEGISVSSFHVPCFSSFINSEMARKQQLEHILHHNARVLNATQTD